jgi:hypothetical protein
MELLRSAARAAAAIASCVALGLHAQGVSEPSVKAAFLFKFAGYIEWPSPPPPGAPFVIATLAADEVAAELARILPGRSVAERPAVVRVVREGDSLAGVQILFIGRRAGEARKAIREARALGVLVVTETSLEAGGAINFVVAEDRVGFEVSLEAAEKGGHRISSRMLGVARRVAKAP